MDVSIVSELSKCVDSYEILFQRISTLVIPVSMFISLLNVVKYIILRSYKDDYININSLSFCEDKMFIEDMNETQEETPGQAATEKDDPKKVIQNKIRYGGICPYCCGILTQVYSEKDKIKYVHCEYCGQTIDTS